MPGAQRLQIVRATFGLNQSSEPVSESQLSRAQIDGGRRCGQSHADYARSTHGRELSCFCVRFQLADLTQDKLEQDMKTILHLLHLQHLGLAQRHDSFDAASASAAGAAGAKSNVRWGARKQDAPAAQQPAAASSAVKTEPAAPTPAPAPAKKAKKVKVNSLTKLRLRAQCALSFRENRKERRTLPMPINRAFSSCFE